MILTDSTEVRDQLERGRQSEVETPVCTPRNTDTNSVETADENSGELVRQPHGGALKRGGNWGNKGGGSRSLGFKRRLVELRDEKEALRYVRNCLKGLWGHRAALDARRYIDGLEEQR